MDEQKIFKEEIDNLISNNKLLHAYLIETNNLEDYMPYVLYFIKKIVCPKKSNIINCEKCNICKQIDDGNFINLKIIDTDKQWIKKEEIIKLKKDYALQSFLDIPQIYVIKNAEKLNDSSANSILKFLEEPEDGIIAILLAPNRYNVIKTIVSRCQILSLKNKSTLAGIDDITVKLKENLESPNQILNFQNIMELFPEKIDLKKSLKSLEEYYYFEISKNYNVKQIKFIQIIEEEIEKLRYNVNYKLWLDNLLVRFMEVS